MIHEIRDAATRWLIEYRLEAPQIAALIDLKTKIVELDSSASVLLSVQGPRADYLHVTGGADVTANLGGMAHYDHILLQELAGDVMVRDGTIDLADDPTPHDALGFGFAAGAIPGNIVLQDVNLLGVKGEQSGTHGDCAQCYTDMGCWFLHRVRMTSGYQGLFIKNAPDRFCLGAWLDDVELEDLSGKAKMLWFGDDGFAQDYALDGRPRVFLEDVRVKCFEDRPLRDELHPGPGATWNGIDIGLRTDDDWLSAYWPAESGIIGRVRRV